MSVSQKTMQYKKNITKLISVRKKVIHFLNISNTANYRPVSLTAICGQMQEIVYMYVAT